MPHTATPPPDEVAPRHGDRAAASSPTANDPAASSPAKPAPRYPAQAVPGIAALHAHTLGDPHVVVGVVDGPPDLTHPSLTGANLQAHEPWWLPPTPHDRQGREHGTWTASVISGRPGSILPGLAPRCRLIMLNHPTTDQHVPDPYSAARAIEELTEAGAHVIQYTLAHHSASDDAHPAIKRAIATAIEAGVLVTAPAGNDKGECSIAPAILPGVLAVGAHRADGAMFLFSNHGPAYAGHGITTLGEGVLGATPGDGGIKAQKGTCVSVALVTGIAALLISLQRHLGQPPNPPAVRDALLATARPCTPEQAHGRPERCLNGYLDLPAALTHLFPGIPLLPRPPRSAAVPVAPHPTTAPAVAPAESAPPPGPAAPSRPHPHPDPHASPHASPRQGSQPTRQTNDAVITTLAERPDLDLDLTEPQAQHQPEELRFLAGDMAGRWAALTKLQQRFPQFTLVATDTDGTVIGRGYAVPFALQTPDRGRLPDRGWDEMLTWAFEDTQTGTPPDSLGALSISVEESHRGTGLADRLLAAMKDAARTAGLTQVLAPVRPTRKHHEPHTTMADYAIRTHPDGLPADPWLRTHVRAGGRVIAIAPVSMTVTGSLAQWREWTGLPFDADGPVIVPGALVPVQASLAHDHAVYAEPNIWVHHPLDTPTG